MKMTMKAKLAEIWARAELACVRHPLGSRHTGGCGRLDRLMLRRRLPGKAPMRHRRLVSFAAGVAFAALAILPTVARAETADVAIALAADVSRSIDDEEFQLQRQGYAAAVTNPRFCRPFSRARTGRSPCASSNGQGPINWRWSQNGW